MVFATMTLNGLFACFFIVIFSQCHIASFHLATPFHPTRPLHRESPLPPSSISLEPPFVSIPTVSSTLCFIQATTSSSCSSSSSSSSSSVSSTPSSSLRSSVDELKRVLEREYASFFNPMEREWYSERVTFDDPLTSLSGVDRYQDNVDMLASRTFLGKLLFSDAGIVLHSVTGGAIAGDGGGRTDLDSRAEGAATVVEDVVTRWTLRLTAKILPWQPTARFSGISVYKIIPGGPKGVQVVQQTDYWDSINLTPGGQSYQKMDRSIALSDFLSQIEPGSFVAPSAGPELPYNLLRRGRGYEVRRYPAFVTVETTYERRDEAFLTLGSITSGLNPFSPAIITVQSDVPKSMAWPVAYSSQGSRTRPAPPAALQSRFERQDEKPFGGGEVRVQEYPERVVAVRAFSDASVEAVVRGADRLLREDCQRDGLLLEASSSSNVLQFAQYDAVYTMGKRRGEVWIELPDGSHPWSRPR